MKEWMYRSTILDLGTKMKVSSQLHVSTALPLEKDWIGGWFGLGAGLDNVVKRKTLPPLGIKPRPFSP
jgi:hypothetical protein